jgi:hypothetical protein
MNYKLLAAIPCAVLLLVVHTANANPTPKVEKCPGVEAIRAASSSLTILPDAPPHSPPGFWFGYQYENFDTQEQWGFGIGGIKAKTHDEAFKKIKSSLNTLFLSEGPIITNSGCNICKYKTADGHTADAVTPLSDICK